MSFIVSPVLPFPNISWWANFINPSLTILFDQQEHFEKMSFRNRYMIAGANGIVTLSIPLAEGREQRKPMKDVLICNKTRWQIQHWRTLRSVYNRSPYFEHYQKEIEQLFVQPFEKLLDFNLASILLMQKLSNIKNDITFNDAYQSVYLGAMADIRHQFRSSRYEEQTGMFPQYYQIFADRVGFKPNLSILDLLFSEGPQAKYLLNP
jgi:hypothetical protein